MLRALWRWLTEPQHKKHLSPEYYEYINSEKWQKTRALVFWIWGHRCWYCGTRQGPIQANHLNYKHFSQGGLLEALDCRPACLACHAREDRKRHERNHRAWQNRHRY